MSVLEKVGIAILLVVNLPSQSQAAEWTVDRHTEGVTVKLDGLLVAQYLSVSGAKPILWPLVGPTEERLTRAYPMRKIDGEQHDHVHQRSCWLSHGSVNGINFWSEEPGHGTIKHRKFGELRGGREAMIVSHNDWLAPDGGNQLEDERRLTFRLGENGERLIDFEIKLSATEGPVVFGDTKEGGFGVRMASPIAVEMKQGGRIVNADGRTNEEAWGRQSSWVDYHGPLGGEVTGIAILNHPTSFRYPNHWHVRTYGLFVANPFGVNAFSRSGDGKYTLAAEKSIMLRYRMILHRGNEKEAKLAEAFAKYCLEK